MVYNSTSLQELKMSAAKKKPASKKSKKMEIPKERIKLFIVNLQYLYYLSKESYKYYMDFDEREFEEDSKFIFTAHFFNNHVDKTKLEPGIKVIYQDNMNITLDEISTLLFKTSIQLNLDPNKLLLELMDSQVHIEEDDIHKIRGIQPFIQKRLTQIINVHNHMMMLVQAKKEESTIASAISTAKSNK